MAQETPSLVPAQQRVPLYTPLQVRLASFLGGPFAAVYALHYNFVCLKKDRERKLTLIWGATFIVALLATIHFLPEKFPNSFIPLAYTIAAGEIAAKKQLTKEAIVNSENFVRVSGWRVALVSVIAFIAFLAVIFPLLLTVMNWE